MRKAQLIDQKIPMTLNEIGENSYYFSAVHLRRQTWSKDAKIKKIF